MEGARARREAEKGRDMADFDLTEGLRRMFLAGVGAVATGAEKTQEVLDEFVKKGELTVEQGKTLNQELTRKAREAVDATTEGAVRARMKTMTAEERAAFAAKVAQMADELDAASVTVEVEDAAEGADDAE